MAGEREWAERQLCDDGACTGVIGKDGRCKECGRAAPFWGDERRRGQLADAGDEDASGDEDDDGEADGDDVAAPAGARGARGDDDERVLCVDGDCTGLVGANGKCKECGLPGPKPKPRTVKVRPPVLAAPVAVAAVAEGSVDGEEAEDDEDEDDGDDASYDGDEDDDEDDDDADADDDGAREADASGEADDRKLCPDGSCVGVLDARGVCKVCGRTDAEN